MINSIGQIVRSVGNAGQARHFYEQLLGLEHLYTFGTMVFFNLDGTRLMLNESDAPKADESILYFRVADIQAAHDALSARGVEFLAAPHRIHQHDDGSEEWMAFFKDPDGRPLALMTVLSPA